MKISKEAREAADAVYRGLYKHLQATPLHETTPDDDSIVVAFQSLINSTLDRAAGVAHAERASWGGGDFLAQQASDSIAAAILALKEDTQ